MTIAIIDTGLDTTNPEFAGRISAASADVAGSRGINPQNPHGTEVALVAAAARNNQGIVGIAYEATIMALRADAPNSCVTRGCGFTSTAIVAGFNRAISNGAKVINLSLGGVAPSRTERSAVASAASASIVVVVAAGNNGTTNPDPYGAGLRAAGNGNVIIAGSVNASGVISSFSDRAGTEANWFLTAMGERVCCAYVGGVITTTTFSGTSFSSPQIAGAVALLRQAFPNLTAVQTVNLLLTTARDAGTPGVDPIYGRGIMDITNAFAPQGALTVAGTQSRLPLTTVTGITSPAMGDAGKFAPLSAMMLDSYDRAYRIDLGSRFQSAPLDNRLSAALLSPIDNVAGGNDRVSLGFAIGRNGMLPTSPWQGTLRISRSDAQVAQVMAARVAARLAPHTRIAFGFAQGADGLIAQVQGHSEPAFVIARSPSGDFGFTRSGETAVALRQQLGRWGLTLSAEAAKSATTVGQRSGTALYQRRNRDGMSRFALAADRNFGVLNAGLAASWMSEDRTVLGARLHDSFGTGGADSLFLDATAALPIAPGWRLGAAWRQGFTRARPGGLIAQGSRLTSNAWSFDIAHEGLFTRADSLALRIAQPLRVQSGGLRFDLPVDYSYDTLSATNGISTVNLSPSGREIDGELAWRGILWGGAASASVFYRHSPGNFAQLADDKGLAVSWKTGF